MLQLICHIDTVVNSLSPLSAIHSFRNRHGSVDVCDNVRLPFWQGLLAVIGKSCLPLSTKPAAVFGKSRLRFASMLLLLSALLHRRLLRVAALALCVIRSISSTFAALPGLVSVSLASQLIPLALQSSRCRYAQRSCTSLKSTRTVAAAALAAHHFALSIARTWCIFFAKFIFIF